MRTRTALITGGAAIALAGCGSATTVTATVTQIASGVITNGTVTQTVTETSTTKAPAPAPKPKPAAAAQMFHGTGTENIGSFNVPTDSTLVWTCDSCSSANFAINNSPNDDNLIAVNALNQTSGTTALPAGSYTDVQVLTEGEAWSFTITPGNHTQ